MSAPARRIRGWIAVVLFLVLASLGVAGAWFVLGQHPTPGDIVDVVNIDGDYAVVVRTVKNEPARSFLSLFERQQGERWGGLIPRYAQHDDARTGVTATAEVVAVRTVSSGLPVLIAFAARQGKKLGRVELFEPSNSKVDNGAPGGADDGLTLPAVSHLVGTGESFEFSGQDGSWATIQAVNLRTGQVLWHRDLGPLSIHRAWLRERHLLVQARAGVLVILDRTTGAVVTRLNLGDNAGKRAGAMPCVLDQAVYWLDAGVLRIKSLDTMTEESIPVPGATGARLRGLCGRRGDRLLLTMDHDQGSALLSVSSTGAAGVGQIPGTWHLDAVARQAPDRAPLSGQLTAFVPVLLGEPGGTDGTVARSLAMLDTGSGRVVWQRPISWLAGARLMRGTNRHILYAPERELLVAFDSASGRITAVRRLAGHAGVWPRQLAGGRIWVFRGPDWAVLDSQTLAPLPGTGGAGGSQNVDADTTRELGLSSPTAH